MSNNIQPGIEQRAAKVSAVTGLSTVLSIGLQFLSVPICLHYWGNDTYGAWLAFFAAFSLIRTVDTGYIGYVGNKLNMLYHHGEQALKATLASAIWGVACLGVFQILILALLYITDSTTFLIDTQHSSEVTQEIVLALLVLSVSWIFSGSYLGIVHRLLIPTGMMYQAAWWSMGFQATQFAALIVAAMLGFSILQAALLFAIVQTVIYISSAFYIKTKLPRYYPWWKGSNTKIGFDDLWCSVPLTLGGVFQQGGNNGLIMVVSAFLGPAAVPAYATVKTLSNLWVNLINILTAPLLPDVVRFHAKREGSKLMVVHYAHWLLIGFVVNFSILIAYPFLETIYGVWTNNILLLDKPLLDFLLATVSLAGMNALMNTFLSGINNSSFIVTSTALRGGLSIFISIILLPELGLIGLGVAILFAEITTLTVTVNWFFKRELAKLIGDFPLPIFGWLWLSSGFVVIYLVVESVGLQFSNIIYWLSFSGVFIGSIFSWRGLDEDIKNRVRSFLISTSGLKKLGKV